MDGEQTLSKNEQKRLAKQKQKEEEKAKKEAEKAKKAAQNPAPAKKAKPGEEDIPPNEYYKYRCHHVEGLKQKGGEEDPYPHKFETTHEVPQLIATFSPKCTEKGVFLDGTVVAVAGRVRSIRTMGSALVFYDVHGEGEQFQVMGNKKLYPSEEGFTRVTENIKRGDIIGVRGAPGRTKAGEFSICPSHLQLLSPCLHVLPTDQYGLKDRETRYRKRYLDLIMNKEVRQTFKTRSRVLNFLRNFLDSYGFLEVETPILNIVAGGATAKPFITLYNCIDRDVFMRVAPELFLKMLIVGGLDKVYEMGKLFRNEDMDQTHNPEFTSIEFYWAYKDYNDLMDFTELMIHKMVMEICGKETITVTDPEGKDHVINFSRPWKRVPMISGLEDATGVKFPVNLESDEARDFLDKLCKKHGVDCSTPRTTARLIDKLAGHFLEPGFMDPTFIIDHPQLMCPLAKYHRSKPGLAERFELFINQKEHCNSYTELNDPAIQRQMFEDQMKNKAKGDEEAQEIDTEFVEALEHALPPTAGWGLGVDRLCMLLTNNPNNIQEVILFPTMKPEVQVGHEAHAAPEKKQDAPAKPAPVQTQTGKKFGEDCSDKSLKEMEAHLQNCQFLSGNAVPGDQDFAVMAAMNKKNFVPDNEKYTNTFGWFWGLQAFQQPARDLWRSDAKGGKSPAKKAQSPKKKPQSPKKSPKKDAAKPAPPADDDFDLFGDETEEDKQAAEALKKKQEDAKKKKPKPAVIAKSTVVFDVKGYEVEYDWDALATKIRNEVTMDGLVWMDKHKIVPIAFGMKKLQMTMLIEDEKVATDDVFEKIQEWEDDVQSTDVVSFNKA